MLAEGKTLPELEKKLARFFDAKGVLLVEELRRAGGKSWTKIDEFEGESINLLIFKEKTALGLTELEAAFETPTGKILKANGFGGTPTILLNTNDEVKILFNP